MVKWKKPNGTIIKTNEEDATLKAAIDNGWEPYEEPEKPKKKAKKETKE